MPRGASPKREREYEKIKKLVGEDNHENGEYTLAEQLLERFKDLKAQGHISIQELDKAESDFAVAKSQQDFYQVKLEQTKILAPFNGLIQSRYLDEGTVINPGLPILEMRCGLHTGPIVAGIVGIKKFQ